MTDESLVNGANGEQPNALDSAVDTTATAAPEQKQEKYFSASEVNSIVKSQVNKAASREYQRGLDAAAQNAVSQQQPVSQPVQQPQVDINKAIDEKLEQFTKSQIAAFEKQQADAFVAQVNQNIDNKINAVKESDEVAKAAFEKVDNFNAYGTMRYYANKFDNGGEILHYLTDNLEKAAQLEMMGRTIQDERIVDAAFKKISDSIAKNKQASNAPKVPNPVSQIESSGKNGYGGSGDMSFKDWQKMLTT